jgi:hypothetical protein
LKTDANPRADGKHDVRNQQINGRLALFSVLKSFYGSTGCQDSISLRAKNETKKIQDATVVFQNQDELHDVTP